MKKINNNGTHILKKVYKKDANGKQTEEIHQYKVDVNTLVKFKNREYFTPKDFDFFMKTQDSVSTFNIGAICDFIINTLNLFKYNGDIYSNHEDGYILVSSDDIDAFSLKYIGDFEPMSYYSKRHFWVKAKIAINAELKKNFITFQSGEEFDENYNQVTSEENFYIGKNSFKINFMSEEETLDNSYQLSLWVDYIHTIFGGKIFPNGTTTEYQIQKVFSSLFWTDKFIFQRMRVMFLVTNGGNGKTTIFQKLRDLMFFKQADAISLDARKKIQMGDSELLNAVNNWIDDYDNTRGRGLRINGEFLKDLTSARVVVKDIGKSKMTVDNIVQTVVFVNNDKYLWEVDEEDFSEMRRVDFIQFEHTKSIKDWDRFKEFANNFDYEWLLNYLFHWFRRNRDQILADNGNDIKKNDSDLLGESVLDYLNDDKNGAMKGSDFKKICNSVYNKKHTNVEAYELLYKLSMREETITFRNWVDTDPARYLSKIIIEAIDPMVIEAQRLALTQPIAQEDNISVGSNPFDFDIGLESSYCQNCNAEIPSGEMQCLECMGLASL